MKTILLLILFLHLHSKSILPFRKLPGDDEIDVPEKKEIDDIIEIPAEILEIQQILDPLIKSYEWTSKIDESNPGIILVEATDPNETVLEILLKAKTIPNQLNIIYTIHLQNKASNNDDTRFSAYQTAHHIFIRQYTLLFKKELGIYMSSCLLAFKEMRDKYKMVSTPEDLTGRINNLINGQKIRGGSYMLRNTSDNFMTFDIISMLDPLYIISVSVNKLDKEFFKVQVDENSSQTDFYANTLFLEDFENNFSFFINNKLASQKNMKVNLESFVEIIKQLTNQRCGSSALAFEIQGDLMTDVLISFKAMNSNPCVFLDSTIFVTKFEIRKAQFFNLACEGAHFQTDYFFGANSGTIFGILTEKMNDIMNVGNFIDGSLKNLKNEEILKEDDLYQILKDRIREEPKDIEIDAGEKSLVEVEGRLFLKSWYFELNNVWMNVFKNDLEYLIEMFGTYKKLSMQIIVPILNGFDQKNLIEMQMDEFLNAK